MAQQLPTRRDSRRAMQRTDCSFAARISFGGVYLCSGIIKDITINGARLLIAGNSWLPGDFELEAEVFGGPVSVRTVWSNKEHVGVKFTGK